ncbi:MAG: epimerase [Thermoplasmatota archaeon]
MRILLTGATGTAGSGALRQAIADPEVESVVVLARREPREMDEKVEFVPHADFLDYGPVADWLVDVDAALWCLGISQFRVDRGELHRITVEFPVAGAKALKAASPGARFLHLSGGGADPTGKSHMPFAQEKGQAETALDALRLAGLWHFRPGYIHPLRPVEAPLFQDRLMWVLQPLLRRVAPFAMVAADELGRAMLAVAKQGHPKHVLENRDIRRAAGLTRGV